MSVHLVKPLKTPDHHKFCNVGFRSWVETRPAASSQVRLEPILPNAAKATNVGSRVFGASSLMSSQLAEFGVILPQGVYHVLQFAKDCVGGELAELPTDAEEVIFGLCDQLLFLHAKILRHSRHMMQIAKREKRVALLRTINAPT